MVTAAQQLDKLVAEVDAREAEEDLVLDYRRLTVNEALLLNAMLEKMQATESAQRPHVLARAAIPRSYVRSSKRR